MLPVNSQSQPYEEVNLYAAYILNFAKFISWKNDDSRAATICVVNNHQLGSAIAYLRTQSNNINVNKVLSEQINSSFKKCQFLFLDKTIGSSAIRKILFRVEEKHIVTISDNKDFLNNGGAIQFIKTKDKLYFNVSEANLEGTGVKVSPYLLEAAQHVY